jgi:hypothetical protein
MDLWSFGLGALATFALCVTFVVALGYYLREKDDRDDQELGE